MTEKLFTGTLNHNQNKTKKNIRSTGEGLSHQSDVSVKNISRNVWKMPEINVKCEMSISKMSIN